MPERHWVKGTAETEAARTAPVKAYLPWETWAVGRDSSGHALGDNRVASADEMALGGSYAAALSQYRKIYSSKLKGADQEALVFRMSSMALALKQYREALKLLSDHFRARAVPVEAVSSQASLLFATAYSGQRNSDQALAWFSKSFAAARGEAGMASRVERGVADLLQSLSDPQFENVALEWAREPFVDRLIGQERVRRNRTESVAEVAVRSQDTIQAMNPAEEVVAVPAVISTPAAAVSSVTGPALTAGVLLPLSGRFAGFGNSLKNGIELAVEAARNTDGAAPLKLVYRDSSGTAAEGSTAAQELINNDQAAMLFGPLVSEVAGSAVEVARSSGIPMLTFSKSSSLQCGGGVFRLGPTAESQIASLLEVTHKKLGLTELGLVFADDENGREYAAAFRRLVDAQGQRLVFEASYPAGDNNAQVGIAAQLESRQDVQAIMVPESPVVAARFFSALGQDARSRIRPLGPASWDNPLQLANSRTALSGAVFVSLFYKGSQRPLVSRFVESYEEKYGRAPDFFAAQGFDAASMILAGLNRASQSSVSIADAVSGIEAYQGLTGTISVRADGEFDRRFVVLQMEGESYTELSAAPDFVAQNPSFTMRGNEEITQNNEE